MDFLLNYWQVLFPVAIASILVPDLCMSGLQRNRKWRITISTKECIANIFILFTAVYLGGHFGLAIQEGFAHQSAALSLLTDTPQSAEYFAMRAAESEPAVLCALFAFLFGFISHTYFTSNRVSVRNNRLVELQTLCIEHAYKYGNSHINTKLAILEHAKLKSQLYHNVNEYCDGH